MHRIAARPRRAAPMIATNRRVLIADDDESIRSLLVDLLTDEGYEALEAATGKEMLEIYHGPQHPALVLMDVQMPDMTGLEALREISQTAGGEALPIIMMTAFTTASIAIEATMLGAFDYLNKPFDIEYVLQKVAPSSARRSRKRRWTRSPPKQISVCGTRLSAPARRWRASSR